MTLWAWVRPRSFPRLPPPESRMFEVAPEARVVARCHWQRPPAGSPTIVALHGLEGSSDAHYMTGLAEKAWVRGFNVVRLNQRNCGGTEHLSATLYHSGLSSDVAVVVETLAAEGHSAIVVAGYSLGGNLALKLAGDYGGGAPAALKGVVAVSPVMDLPRCVDALERRSNFIYQWNFVRNLKGRMRRKAALFPGRFRPGRSPASGPCGNSTRCTPRLSLAFGTPRTTTTARRRCASWIASRFPRSSSRRPTIRSCRPIRSATPPCREPARRLALSPHGGHCAFVPVGGPATMATGRSGPTAFPGAWSGSEWGGRPTA